MSHRQRLKQNPFRGSARKTPESAANSFRNAFRQYQAGELGDAERLCRDILAADPNHADSLHLLGAILYQTGHFDPAIDMVRQAISTSPKLASYHFNLGKMLQELKRLDDAADCFSRVVELRPDDPEAHRNLGKVISEQGRLEDAADCFRTAIKLKPDHPEAHVNLGSAMMGLARLDEAIACFCQAINARPHYPEAYNNLGSALVAVMRTDEALACFDEAIRLKPDHNEAYNNRSVALLGLWRLDEAAASARKVLSLKPNAPETYTNLGNIVMHQGRPDEALACYARALEIKPDFFPAHSTRLFIQNYLMDQSPERSLDTARRFGALVSGLVGQVFAQWQGCQPGQPLRVGVVSSDLCSHPVGYFLEGLLRAADPARIAFVAFPSHFREDRLTSRIKPYFASWKPIHALNDEAAARLIHDAGVQVLLDLSGHTAGSRLPVFAWRPAPVQASWLGYFATTGVAEMDYIIGDSHVAPPDEAGHFTETLWRLPEIYYCFTPPDVTVDVSGLPAMSTGHVTFGCFNNLNKVNDGVVAVWARVLDAVAGSRLLLKAQQLQDPGVRAGIRERFAAHGVVSERLELEPSSSRVDYLRAYHRIDIALDPFPFPGGTTSCEALWMGVPVLTRRGDRFLSHAGETIIHNARLPDWIAADGADYVAKAARFTANLNQLADLRAGLRDRVLASPVFDAARFARHFETAMWGMWNRWLEAQ